VAQTVELNRGRREARAAAGFNVLPTQAGFPFATYAAKVSRAWDWPHKLEDQHYEQVWLLASHRQITAKNLLGDIRLYWRIEGVLHQRLDCSRLDEDRSRVRTPDNVLNLAMFRRLAVALAIAWCRRQTNPRLATTNGFLDTLARDNGRPALRVALTSQRAARHNLMP
jgi:predicted transposase YbfD/YdcC